MIEIFEKFGIKVWGIKVIRDLMGYIKNKKLFFRCLKDKKINFFMNVEKIFK